MVFTPRSDGGASRSEHKRVCPDAGVRVAEALSNRDAYPAPVSSPGGFYWGGIAEPPVSGLPRAASFAAGRKVVSMSRCMICSTRFLPNRFDKICAMSSNCARHSPAVARLNRSAQVLSISFLIPRAKYDAMQLRKATTAGFFAASLLILSKSFSC